MNRVGLLVRKTLVMVVLPINDEFGAMRYFKGLLA